MPLFRKGPANNTRPVRASRRISAVALVLLLLDQLLMGAATPAAPPPTHDIGWPRQVTQDGSELIYYQPQVDEWTDYKTLFARVAFSLTPKGEKQVLGVASMEAGTIVDKDSRTVFIRDVKVDSVRFPSLDEASVPAMEQLFRKLVPQQGEPISVDRVMADLQQGKVQAQPVPVKNDPPQIFYSSKPAVLLTVQGEPVLAPIQKTDLHFVVNTNWDLFFEKSKKHYFLLANKTWLTAQDLKGPWVQTQALPKDMAKLPAGENFDDVKKMVPPPPPSGSVPAVFFSTTPAELILLKGSPVYSRIPQTQLLYVTNTDNDVFVDDAQKQYYVPLSGRWFRSPALEGPWTYPYGCLFEPILRLWLRTRLFRRPWLSTVPDCSTSMLQGWPHINKIGMLGQNTFNVFSR